MLFPILIFIANVKKNLYNRYALAIPQLLTRWSKNLLYANSDRQFFPLPLTIVDAEHINYYFMKRVIVKLPEIPPQTDCYVFASYQEKPQDIFQQMDGDDRENLLQQIKSDYREILIYYFTTEKTLKSRIDKFINAVFCANIPVPQIIEIHMELIEEFATQLKLEGRSDETLLDYRLTLIDILAHLCETYRCSIYK
ncbi:KaiA family protein [Calothrix brevissima NIES-22]|nr:KaiA family protein [Calothrix brevissima NIES-22]